jgi:hypothetical protein
MKFGRIRQNFENCPPAISLEQQPEQRQRALPNLSSGTKDRINSYRLNKVVLRSPGWEQRTRWSNAQNQQ